jgi:hypothetical protein
LFFLSLPCQGPTTPLLQYKYLQQQFPLSFSVTLSFLSLAPVLFLFCDSLFIFLQRKSSSSSKAWSGSSIVAMMAPLALVHKHDSVTSPTSQHDGVTSSLTAQLLKWFYGIFTGTAIRATPLWFFIGEGLSL